MPRAKKPGTTINFNVAAARAVFGDAKKVRIRFKDGEIFVKPTDRKVNNVTGEGEEITEVQTRVIKKEGSERIAGMKAHTGRDLKPGQKFELVKDSYNWYRLNPIDKVYHSIPAAAVY